MEVEEEGLLSVGSKAVAGSPEPKRFKGDGRDVMEDSSAESGGVRPGSGGSGGVGQGLSGLGDGKGGGVKDITTCHTTLERKRSVFAVLCYTSSPNTEGTMADRSDEVGPPKDGSAICQSARGPKTKRKNERN